MLRWRVVHCPYSLQPLRQSLRLHSGTLATTGRNRDHGYTYMYICAQSVIAGYASQVPILNLLLSHFPPVGYLWSLSLQPNWSRSHERDADATSPKTHFSCKPARQEKKRYIHCMCSCIIVYTYTVTVIEKFPFCFR